MNSGEHRALDVRPLAGLAHLLTMAQESGSVADRLPGWMFRLALCEQAATSALICSGWSMPALLRTLAYEEAWQQDQFPAHRAEFRACCLDRSLPVRHDRRVRVLLDEAILMRPVGGWQVMAEQLGHLADLSEAGAVCVRVVPLDRSALVPYWRVSALLLPGVLHLYMVESDHTVYCAGLDKGARQQHLLKKVLDAALPQGQSIDLLRQARKAFRLAHARSASPVIGTITPHPDGDDSL
ncbi:Scr1 family TA system antitoxin-like transcriptional regulator [Streptomyces sp. WM6378]|uniref:Scr1 family TA system antitoxin-like transcriptional regulator n=1 Tax=Streptomyces sp. WM6378 TaxID=1415557 RepID=UPI0006AE643D|nr:Scr1 family TA system antitoxin-like transcriptional regulator [Streptomyces sp. WM6378]